MFTILFTFFPRTFAGCSWPASVRWKEYGGGGHLCLLSHETSQIGLKIVISRVVNKTRTRGRGRGRGLFFFLKNVVFSRFIDCVAWRFCRTHYWAAKPQKRARSVHERAAKPQVLTVSLPSPTFPLRARPKPPCYAGYAIHISSVFFIKMNCSGAHFMQSSPSNYRNIYQRQFNFGITESDKATLIHL